MYIGMDKNFYIILSSKTADFHLTLPNPINLVGQYEVGLIEFSYTLSYPNLDETEFYVLPQQPAGAPPAEEVQTPTRIVVPKGVYRDVGAWLQVCHNSIPQGLKQYLTIVKTTSAGQYEITIGKADVKANGGLRFSDYTQQILQLPGNEIRGAVKGYANLNVNKNFLIIEADFVEAQWFNNSIRPFLSISHINFINFEYGAVIQKQIVTPLFVPVIRQSLHHLNLTMKFESNRQPEFQTGWNHIILYFRSKKS